MVARTDKITGNRQQEVFYSDFTDNLTVHPNSGQIVKVTNSKSIKQSLKNLILTNRGERLYQPLVGGNVSATLFEPMDDFTANDLKDAIIDTVRNNEPRVNKLQVTVTPDFDQNGYYVNVVFGIVNQKELDQFELLLIRTR